MLDTVEICSYPDLDSRIRILRVGDEVDAICVRTQRFCALVDTLSTPRLCEQALEILKPDLAGRPLLVVNSHMDWDHFWGNSAVADRAPIIAHTRALDRLRDARALDVLRKKSSQEERFREVKIVGPTVTFSGSLTLDGGDLTLELLHTPGHAPDHLSVWIPEIRTCLAVDTVEDPVPQVWSDDPSDLSALRASLERVRDLDAKLVLPAHGRTSSPNVVDQNLAYFDDLADRVRSIGMGDLHRTDLAEQAGLTLEDLIPNFHPTSMAVAQFYRRFHAKNLSAVVRSRLEEDKGR